MFGVQVSCLADISEEYYKMEDYASSNVPRWCSGCGDHSILTAVQKVCRDEQLPPEKTVFVSGIGCSSRFPHYMRAYGFHSLHGRALPVAEGIRFRRPDLNIFVNMGDGDCCSIGGNHWLHAIRYNMHLTVVMHDNNIYALTKNQTSPTSKKGLKSNTHPYGGDLEPLNPLTVTLGVTNVSFVAQVVEWMPNLLYEIVKLAHHHKGFAFIRVLQRCPVYTPQVFQDFVTNLDNILLLRHEQGVNVSDADAKIFKSQQRHDPMDWHQAMNLASLQDKIPVGILYRNPNVPDRKSVV